MYIKEQTDSIIEKLTKEALGKMTDEELSEKIKKFKKNIKKDGSTLGEIVFMVLEEQINAMVENHEYKKRCGIGKNEIISKDEAREKIIKYMKST